jgi:hypothetical protein
MRFTGSTFRAVFERLRAWSWSAYNIIWCKISRTWGQCIILVIHTFYECFFSCLESKWEDFRAAWSMGAFLLQEPVRTKMRRIIFRNFEILKMNLRSHWGFPQQQPENEIFSFPKSCIRVSNRYEICKFGGCGRGWKGCKSKSDLEAICTFLSFGGVEFKIRYPYGTPTVEVFGGGEFWPFRRQESGTRTRMVWAIPTSKII